MKYALIFEDDLTPEEPRVKGLLGACLQWIDKAYKDGWQGAWSLRFWLDTTSKKARDYGLDQSIVWVNVRLGNRNIVNYFYVEPRGSIASVRAFRDQSDYGSPLYNIDVSWDIILQPYIKQMWAVQSDLCLDKIKNARADFEELKTQTGHSDLDLDRIIYGE